MTTLLITQSATEAAQALLKKIDEIKIHEGTESFYPSVLRLKVKPTEVINRRPTNDPANKADRGYYESEADGVTVMAKVIPSSSQKIWYRDDDYGTAGTGGRLGDVNRKLVFQKVEGMIQSWYDDNTISKLVHDAIENLWPKRLDPLTGYGVKLDLYTNRVLPGWHQDWDDGCALLVGLLNVTREIKSAQGVPIPGTEILNFATDDARKSHPAEWKTVFDAASPLRKALIRNQDYEAGSLATAELQPFGQMRWFNDAVLVHRTPPFHVNTLTARLERFETKKTPPHKLEDLNKRFTVGIIPKFVSFEFPNDNMVSNILYRDENRYKMNQAFDPNVSRALLRITVRQLRDSNKNPLDAQGRRSGSDTSNT